MTQRTRTLACKNHLVWMLFLLVSNLAGPAWAQSGSQLFVSVAPQRYFIKRIGGEQVDVHLMVQPGESPATYSPPPQKVARLATADAYFRIGVPFESAWMERIRAANPDLKIVDLAEGIELHEFARSHSEGKDQDEDEHGDHSHHDDHHHHAGIDPHIWTDPLRVKAFLPRITEVLTQLQPDHAHQFRANAAMLADELEQLHQSIAKLFTEQSNRRFLVFHPAWGYFAERYDLDQVAIEYAGKEPGAQALASLIAQARSANARAIFVQPQFSQRAARQIADAIDADLHVADPLAEDYQHNLLQVAKQIAEAGLH